MQAEMARAPAISRPITQSPAASTRSIRAWTGFAGKQLWDWLHLMLFPVAVVRLPEWVRNGEPFEPRHVVIATIVLGGFAVLLVGGYRWAARGPASPATAFTTGSI
jgi:hypothetical protein